MALITSAKNFKPNSSALTEFRLRLVMNYISYCYLAMRADNKTYDFNKKGKIPKEDFLRNGLVDDYLSQNKYKEHYKRNISDSPGTEIYFQKEENHTYNLDGTLAEDYIDISIKENKLSDALSGITGDEIKFAVECKRIKSSADYDEYIKDIEKFTVRPFTSYRLAYEGQVAFIENSSFTHQTVSNEINKKLISHATIKTIQNLTSNIFNKDFDGSYLSKHHRNHGKKLAFSIFHLMFDYSGIVLNDT